MAEIEDLQGPREHPVAPLYIKDIAKLIGFKSKESKINIINDVSGIIKPGRLTLLLGPPGCEKTSLLKALSGNLVKSLKVRRYVYQDVVRLDDLQKLIDCSYVQDFVIEALRSIAELITYSDQRDATFFEFFMEKQVMGEFVRVL